jgi:hypothetical protein
MSVHVPPADGSEGSRGEGRPQQHQQAETDGAERAGEAVRAEDEPAEPDVQVEGQPDDGRPVDVVGGQLQVVAGEVGQ